jgi:hypothetical protein
VPLKTPRLRTRVHRKPHHRDVAVYLEFSSIPKFIAFCDILRGESADAKKIRQMNVRLSRSTTTLKDAEQKDRALRTGNPQPATRKSKT